MIDCNGTHVITHKHKHGNSVYRCTLANAQKLLDECLKNEAPDLAELAEQLKTEARPVRPFDWLVKALSEVVEMKDSPVRLRMVLFGAGPKLRTDPDPRPVPVITKEMQDELVLFFFRNKFDLQMLSGRLAPTLEMLTACWNSLSFLEPARQRLAVKGGPEVRFIENHMSEALDALQPLQRNRWKADAREERIVGEFVMFLSEWGSGQWDIEKVTDLVADAQPLELPAGMTRLSPQDKTTYPPVGQVVVALLRGCSTGRTEQVELVHVEEDDVSWRTADDMSEISYDWDVVGWRFPAQPA